MFEGLHFCIEYHGVYRAFFCLFFFLGIFEGRYFFLAFLSDGFYCWSLPICLQTTIIPILFAFQKLHLLASSSSSSNALFVCPQLEALVV